MFSERFYWIAPRDRRTGEIIFSQVTKVTGSTYRREVTGQQGEYTLVFQQRVGLPDAPGRLRVSEVYVNPLTGRVGPHVITSVYERSNRGYATEMPGTRMLLPLPGPMNATIDGRRTLFLKFA